MIYHAVLVDPQGGGAAAVEVERLEGAQVEQELREVRQVDADRPAGPAPVEGDQVYGPVQVDTQAGAWMPVVDDGICKAFHLGGNVDLSVTYEARSTAQRMIGLL